jgi:hypothetical protein
MSSTDTAVSIRDDLCKQEREHIVEVFAGAAGS